MDKAASEPRHIVSDGDRAIASAIDIAYDRDTPHQLWSISLLRECKRNIGGAGFSEGKAARGSEEKAPIGSDDMEQARDRRPDSGVDGREGAVLAQQSIAKKG